MAKINLPQLDDEQVKEIQAAYAAGESVNAISIKTKIRYPVVWFFTVNEGRPAPPEPIEKHEPCWCGKPHKAKGLCEGHYKQMRRQLRRAA